MKLLVPLINLHQQQNKKLSMKRILLLLTLILSGFSLFSQSYGNFRQLRFFVVNVASDTAANVANQGRMWYDFTTDKFRCNINGINSDLSGSGQSANVVTNNEYYDSIYQKTLFSSLTDFTQNGGTYSLSGGKILASNGTHDFTKSLELNYYTGLDRIIITSDIIATNVSASFGLGVAGTNTAQLTDWACYVNGSVVYISSGTTPLTQRITGSAFTINANDTIRLIAERDQGSLRLTITNLTTNEQDFLETTFVYTPAGTDLLPYNTGKPCIWNFGGTFSVINLNIRSYEFKNSNLFIGDSKLARRNIETIGKSITDFLQSNYNSISLNAGSSDRTTDVILKLPELNALTPIKCFVNIGRNDLAAGTPIATIEANLTTIYNSLVAGGAEVFFLTGFYETNVNQSALNAWIIANYPNNYINTSMEIPLAPDGTHPQMLGHFLIYQKIKESGHLINPKLNQYLRKNSVVFSDNYGLLTSSPQLSFVSQFDQPNNILTIGTGVTAGSGVVGSGVGYANLYGNYPSGTAFYIIGQIAGVNQMGLVQDNAGNFGSGRNMYFRDFVGAQNRLGIAANGNIYIGNTGTPTALMHFKAGTATANTAPLKFTSGTINTVSEPGAVEYDGTNFYGSNGTDRGIFVQENNTLWNLGTSTTGGSTRTLAAIGSSSDVDWIFQNKGGNRQFFFNTTSGNAIINVGGSATALSIRGGSSSTVNIGSDGTTTSGVTITGSTTVPSIGGGVGGLGLSILSNNGDAGANNGGAMSLTGGNGFVTSGNGNGGGITISSGIRRTAGSGTDGNITLETNNATGTLRINDGANEQMGTATLVGGTITVNNTKVTANSRIFLTIQAAGGTLGSVYISARVAGTSFTITSSSALDTSAVAWFIIEPN